MKTSPLHYTRDGQSPGPLATCRCHLLPSKFLPKQRGPALPSHPDGELPASSLQAVSLDSPWRCSRAGRPCQCSICASGRLGRHPNFSAVRSLSTTSQSPGPASLPLRGQAGDTREQSWPARTWAMVAQSSAPVQLSSSAPAGSDLHGFYKKPEIQVFYLFLM